MYEAIYLTVDEIKGRKQIFCYPVHNFMYTDAKVKETDMSYSSQQMITSTNVTVVLILFVTDINC